MVLRKNSDLVPISRSVTTKPLYPQDPKPQRLPRRKIRLRSQPSYPNIPHPCGSTASLSPVRASWLPWLLWPCFTPTTITLVGPKSGSWQEDSWHPNLHRLLHHDIKNTFRMHNYNCNYLASSLYPLSSTPFKMQKYSLDRGKITPGNLERK